MARDVLQLFAEEPWLPVRHFESRLGRSLQDVRAEYTALRDDAKAQSRISSLAGPQRFFVSVLRDTLCHDWLLDHMPKEPSEMHEARPWILELHPGLSCPCSCVFCYSMGEGLATDERGYRYADETGALDESDFVEIIRAFAEDGGKCLNLSGGLEPLSCAFTPELARAAVDAGLETWLYTNGIPDTADDGTWRWFVENLDSIRFSIHAATAPTYHRTQVPHLEDRHVAEELFSRAVRRVEAAVSRRDELRRAGRRAARIGVTFVAVKYNWGQIPEAARLWVEKGVDFFDIRLDTLTADPRTTPLTLEEIATIKNDLEVAAQRIAADTNTVVSASRRPLADERGPVMTDRCYAPFAKIAVNPWGTVFTCCMRAHPACTGRAFQFGATLCSAAPHLYPVLRGKELPLPWHCNQCNDWEVAFNRACCKIRQDREDGIPPHRQPVTPMEFRALSAAASGIA